MNLHTIQMHKGRHFVVIWRLMDLNPLCLVKDEAQANFQKMINGILLFWGYAPYSFLFVFILIRFTCSHCSG